MCCRAATARMASAHNTCPRCRNAVPGLPWVTAPETITAATRRAKNAKIRPAPNTYGLLTRRRAIIVVTAAVETPHATEIPWPNARYGPNTSKSKANGAEYVHVDW